MSAEPKDPTSGTDQVASPVSKEEEEERLHFQKVVNAFRLYKRHALTTVEKRERYMKELPVEHQKMLDKHGYKELLTKIRAAVEENGQIVGLIISDVDNLFENVSHNTRGSVCRT